MSPEENHCFRPLTPEQVDQVGWVKIPMTLQRYIMNNGGTASAVLVAHALAETANLNGSYENICISREVLAKRAGVSIKGISRATACLERLGVLFIGRTKYTKALKSDAGRLRNIYSFSSFDYLERFKATLVVKDAPKVLGFHCDPDDLSY